MKEKKEKPFWFPMYPMEFMADRDITLMDLPAQAILFRCWMLTARENIPNDPRAVAKLAGADEATTELYWADLRKFFGVDPDGTLYSPRQRRELEKFHAKREAQREGARKGNAKRWGTREQAPPTPAPEPPSPAKEKKPRRTKADAIGGYSEEIKAFVEETCAIWPKEDPVDGRVIVIGVPGASALAERVDQILKEQPHLTIQNLADARAEYLNPEAPRNRYAAPRYFFGPKGDWAAIVRAHLSRGEALNG